MQVWPWMGVRFARRFWTDSRRHAPARLAYRPAENRPQPSSRVSDCGRASDRQLVNAMI